MTPINVSSRSHSGAGRSSHPRQELKSLGRSETHFGDGALRLARCGRHFGNLLQDLPLVDHGLVSMFRHGDAAMLAVHFQPLSFRHNTAMLHSAHLTGLPSGGFG